VIAGLTAAALALGAAGWGATRVGVRLIERRWPPRGRFVEVEGARLHLVIRAPDGAPRGDVVLIHGASGNSADMMEALGEPLTRRGFRVVAVDRPGHGWSARGEGRDEATPARQAALLRAALERVGVHRATVVGHSWGATVAANLAVDHRDFASGLALLAPALLEWPGGVSWYYDLAAAPVVGRVFCELLVTPLGWLGMKGGVASVFAPQAPPPHFIERTGVPLVLRPKAFRANARDVAWLKPFLRAQGPRIAQIATPTVVVTGDSDGVVYTWLHSDGAMGLIKGARRVDLPGVGHSPHHAAPEAVAAAIEDVATRAQDEALADAKEKSVQRV
jgi:pimeloyl-ACP methyl ester carboxylesterase